MSTELASPSAAGPAVHVRLDLERYRQVSHALESTQTEVEKLEDTEAFEVFKKIFTPKQPRELLRQFDRPRRIVLP